MPVVVKGLAETRAALRKFEPDLLKESDRAMRAVLKVIVVQAKGYVPRESPMQNWDVSASSTMRGKWSGDRAFSSSAIKRGIRSRIGRGKINAKGFRAVYSIINATAAGAIYETAGRKTGGQQGNSNNPKAGAQFIDNIQKQADQWTPYGQPHGKAEGRLVFAAVAKNKNKAAHAIAVAVGNTETIFHSRANARAAFGGGQYDRGSYSHHL